MPPVGGGGEEDDDFLSLLGDRVLRLRTPPPEEEEVSIIYYCSRVSWRCPSNYILLSLSIHAYRSWHWASSEVQSRHTLGRHGLLSTMGVLVLLALWDLILMSS